MNDNTCNELVGKTLRFQYVKGADGTREDMETYTVLVDRATETHFSGPCLERGNAIRHFRVDRIVKTLKTRSVDQEATDAIKASRNA